MFRPVANPHAFIACVQAVGDVQDRAADADRIDAFTAPPRPKQIAKPEGAHAIDRAPSGRPPTDARPSQGLAAEELVKSAVPAAPKPRGRQGFASMSPEKRSAIAAMGGASTPADKRSFSRNAELAASAGRKGGLAGKGGRAQRTAEIVATTATPVAPKAAIPSLQTRYDLTDHEFRVYGVLRAKHGMSQEQAAQAVLRSRQSAPKAQET